MYLKEDAGMMEKIFCLSDFALTRMINHMFGKEYKPETEVEREWTKEEPLCVCLTVGCTDRYEYRLIHEYGCFQVQASELEDRRHKGEKPVYTADRVREPGFSYYGKNIEERGTEIREYSGKECVSLSVCTVTLADLSAERLREMGMVLFLPFLFYGFLGKEREKKEKQDALKYLMIYDIPETLHAGVSGKELTVYDEQKLKQLCRKMAWNLLVLEDWMSDLEMQDLIMESLDADLEMLEQEYRTVLQQIDDGKEREKTGFEESERTYGGIPVHRENTN